MGVGSSLIAAVMHNRRAIGCEKEEEYVAIARQRLIEHFNGTLRRRPLGKPVHQPTGAEKVSQIPDEWKSAPQDRLLESKGENWDLEQRGVADIDIPVLILGVTA